MTWYDVTVFSAGATFGVMCCSFIHLLSVWSEYRKQRREWR